MSSEQEYLLRLTANGDREARETLIRLLQRKGLTGYVIFNREMEFVQELFPEENTCNGSLCGGCDDCRLLQAYHADLLILDCCSNHKAVVSPCKERGNI